MPASIIAIQHCTTGPGHTMGQLYHQKESVTKTLKILEQGCEYVNSLVARP